MSRADISRLCQAIQNKWLCCLPVCLLAILAACWPDGLSYLSYDRAAIMKGEIWRGITAHLVHLNTPHLILNLCGLLLIGELIWGELPLKHGFGLLLFSGATISTSLWWLQPEVVSYVGLSGALHGLWAGCTLFGLSNIANASLRERLTYLVGAILLLIKLLMEFYYGPSEITENLIGGSVLTAAHLYGGVAGAVYVLVLCCVRMLNLSRGALQQK